MDNVHDLMSHFGTPLLFSSSMSHHRTNNLYPNDPYSILNNNIRVVPNENDVLCGRGVNIAQHPGNERFRTLVNAKRDAAISSCDGDLEAAAALEKREVAEGIIAHIKGLNPPGRFLRRQVTPGRRSSTRGKNGTGLDLSGTWQILSDREAIKKACQALRDCARTDRSGYAVGVLAPPDVQEVAHCGMKRSTDDSSTEFIAPESFADAFALSVQSASILEGGRFFLPSVDMAASWLKKQKGNNDEEESPSAMIENGSIYSSSRNHSAGDLSADATAAHAVAMSMLSPHMMMSASPQLYGAESYAGDDRSFTPDHIIAAHQNDTFDHSHPTDDVSISVEAAEVAANLVSSLQNDTVNSDWVEEMTSARDETLDDDMDHPHDRHVYCQSRHGEFTVVGVEGLENLESPESQNTVGL